MLTLYAHTASALRSHSLLFIVVALVVFVVLFFRVQVLLGFLATKHGLGGTDLQIRASVRFSQKQHPLQVSTIPCCKKIRPLHLIQSYISYP